MAIKHQDTPAACEYVQNSVARAFAPTPNIKSGIKRMMTALEPDVIGEMTNLRYNRTKMVHAVIREDGSISLTSIQAKYRHKLRDYQIWTRSRTAISPAEARADRRRAFDGGGQTAAQR